MSLPIFNFEHHAVSMKLGCGLLIGLVTCWLCFHVLRLVYFKPTWQSLAVNALTPTTEVLVLGSSRVHFGIDPQQYAPELMSLPANYLNAIQMENLWQRYRPRLLGLKMLIVEFDMVTLAYDTLRISPAAMVRLGLIPWPMLADWRWDFDHAVHRLLWPFFLWRLLPESYAHFMQDYASSYEPKGARAGYIPSTIVLSFAAERLHAELGKASQDLAVGRPGIFAENVRAMARLLRQATANQVKVLLVHFPRHRALRSAYPLKWDAAVRQTRKDLQAAGQFFEFLDYTQDESYTDDEFRDLDHLNSAGAKHLARQLGPVIDRVLNVQGASQP